MEIFPTKSYYFSYSLYYSHWTAAASAMKDDVFPLRRGFSYVVLGIQHLRQRPVMFCTSAFAAVYLPFSYKSGVFMDRFAAAPVAIHMNRSFPEVKSRKTSQIR